MNNVKYQLAKIIKEGSANGIIKVSSSAGFVKGATVFISANEGFNKQLVIDEIIDSQTMAVKEHAKNTYTRYNCSHLKPFLNPKITQPEQFIDPVIVAQSKTLSKVVAKDEFSRKEELTDNEQMLHNSLSLLNNRISEIEKIQHGLDKNLKFYKTFSFRFLIPSSLVLIGSALGVLLSKVL